MPEGSAKSEGTVDPNSILFKYQPSGASFATASQDRLAQRGITGVTASQKMAESDASRVMAHKEKFISAAKQFGLPPALLAAIASRESRGGAVLKKGLGDNGNGFGLMQVDKRSHTIEGMDDPFGLEHIMQATRILDSSREEVKKRHPDWPEERQLQGGVAAYNVGPKNVQTLKDMDKGTTGNDYSNDVWARAQFYAEQMGAIKPAEPSLTVAALKPLANMQIPAPPMSDVEAGKSVLQRNMQGEAVLAMQQSLMNLNFLILSEEQKEKGLSTFGPLTEKALQSFQRDAYIPASGVLDAVTHLALRQLIEQSIKNDGDNHVGIVRRLQDRLAELGHLPAAQVGTGYGTFGSKTEGALKKFQKQQKLAEDGVLTVESFLALRASAPVAPPLMHTGAGDDKKVESQLPNMGPGFIAKGGATKRSAQFCTEKTLNQLMAFAAIWMQKHPDRPLRIGEMSVQGGGKFGAHVGAGHTGGFAIDIGLFRKDGQNLGTNFKDQSYDRKLTQELVTALDETPGVFMIIFNDPEVTASSKLRRGGPHNDHLHVEFRKR